MKNYRNISRQLFVPFSITRFLFIGAVALSSFATWAGELNNVTLSDQTQVGAKKLVLNGMGLRKVYKWGIPVKVYVAGLYLEKKNTDSYLIVKNDEVKKLVLHFVRPLDRNVLIEGFQKAYDKSCFLDCANKSKQFALFSKNVVPMRKDNEIILIFSKDKIEMESTGPNAKKATKASTELSRNMLALFINKENPPGEEFRKGLLGITEKL